MLNRLLLMLALLASIWAHAAFVAAQSSDSDPMALGLRPAFVDDLAAYPATPRYTVDLNLTADFERADLIGRMSIVFTNTYTEPLDEIVIRTYPNLPSFGGDVRLSNATLNNNPVEFTLDETRTIVGFPFLPSQPLLTGESVTLAFDLAITVLHGRQNLYNQFSYLDTELALASFLPMLSVYEPGRGWWRGADHRQGDAVYSGVANWDVRITAPDYLPLITSGSEVERVDNANGTVTHRFVAPLMRDFSMMASTSYQVVSGFYEDIQVNVHYLPGWGGAGAEKALQWTIDALAAFTLNFGEYPYTELDVVETLTAAGGIEYPGLIVVADSLWNPNSQRWFEWVTVHEVAHQWWYAVVGNNQVQFPWLDEAVTDYSVAVYQRHVYGDLGYQEVIDNYTATYTEYEATSTNRLIGVDATVYDVNAYLALVYRKGAVFYSELARTYGLQTIMNGLADYYTNHRYAIATPFDLQDALEAAVGAELDNWFNTWIGYSN